MTEFMRGDQLWRVVAHELDQEGEGRRAANVSAKLKQLSKVQTLTVIRRAFVCHCDSKGVCEDLWKRENAKFRMHTRALAVVHRMPIRACGAKKSYLAIINTECTPSRCDAEA